MAFRYKKDEQKIYLEYERPYNLSVKYIQEKINGNEGYVISNTFIIKNNGLFDEDEDILYFVIEEKEGDYYKLKREVFDIDYDFYVHMDIAATNYHFAKSRTSVVKRIIECVKQDFYIEIKGRELQEGHLPLNVYIALIKSFPTNTEKNLYSQDVIYRLIGEFFSMPDYNSKYQEYLNKHRNNDNIEKFIKYDDELKINRLIYNRVVRNISIYG